MSKSSCLLPRAQPPSPQGQAPLLLSLLAPTNPSVALCGAGNLFGSAPVAPPVRNLPLRGVPSHAKASTWARAAPASVGASITMAANVRRTWDKQAYEDKARARAEAEAEEVGVATTGPAAAAKDAIKAGLAVWPAAAPVSSAHDICMPQVQARLPARR